MRTGRPHEVVQVAPDEAGCWVESSRGWRGPGRVVRIATEHGAVLEPAERRLLEAFEASEDEHRCGVCGFRVAHHLTLMGKEFWVHVDEVRDVNGMPTTCSYIEDGIKVHSTAPITSSEAITGQGGLADTAEEWLNEHVAPEGFGFGWHDGEFMLWSDASWEAI